MRCNHENLLQVGRRISRLRTAVRFAQTPNTSPDLGSENLTPTFGFALDQLNRFIFQIVSNVIAT
jgi:hypothetical protein